MSREGPGKRIKLLERQMLEHARNLEFEKAARTRDQLAALREQAFGAPCRQRRPGPGRCPRRRPSVALEAELIDAISTELVGFRYT